MFCLLSPWPSSEAGVCFFTRKTGNKESLSWSCSRQETQLTRDHPEPALSQSRLQFSEFNLTACLEHFLSNHYPSFSPSKRAIIFLPRVHCKQCYCTCRGGGGVTHLLGCSLSCKKLLEVLRLFPKTTVNLFPDSELNGANTVKMLAAMSAPVCLPFPFMCALLCLAFFSMNMRFFFFTSAFMCFSISSTASTLAVWLHPAACWGLKYARCCLHICARSYVLLDECVYTPAQKHAFKNMQLCGCVFAR